MMLNKNIDTWNVIFYDELSLINKLHFHQIEIYNFEKVGDYRFYFETKRKNRRKIKENFKESKIVHKSGFLNYLEVIVTKTTFLCILISCVSLYNVSRRIWKIEVYGDYKEIEKVIESELTKNNLEVSKYYPSSDGLKDIEGKIALYLSKELEFLELRRFGSLISVRYQKRRTAYPLPQKGNNLYATKDGMIRYFEVHSGVKQVKEYSYVKKGDLLVSDVVESSSGDLINVGTLGSVYANTFYVIDVLLDHEENDEAVIFSKMLDKAKVKIGTYLSKGEKIEIERVLNYSIGDKQSKMKVYYMLLEDITI